MGIANVIPSRRAIDSNSLAIFCMPVSPSVEGSEEGARPENGNTPCVYE